NLGGGWSSSRRRSPTPSQRGHPQQAVPIEFAPPYPDLAGPHDRISIHEEAATDLTDDSNPAEQQPLRLARTLHHHRTAVAARRGQIRIWRHRQPPVEMSAYRPVVRHRAVDRGTAP